MKLEQIYTGCLAHAAYYLESDGEVAIFDPLREVEPYIEKAESNNSKIKYVFETHFHADFVSGHLDLKRKTGADIVFGPTANPNYEAIIAEDNQIFKVGSCQVKVLHTPGHTMESSTYMIIDENGKEHGIITGDTLFIGDVGRPDLAQHVVSDLTEDKLAGHLYDSLRNKILPLSDDLIVYPNHGAGSACGKNMSKETTDTLGNQKKTNYALRPELTKEQFKKELLEGLMPPPGYFPQNVLLNIKGYESFDKIKGQSDKPLSADAFEAAANETGALVLDVRSRDEFATAHIPKSIFIGIDGSFAQWVGAMIVDVKQPILLVADQARLEETITRLSRVGFDNVLGHLDGGFETWKKANKEMDSVVTTTSAGLKNIITENNEPAVFDVRKKSEFDSEHAKIAINTPLDSINDHLAEFPTDKTFYVHCAGGYRSMIASSILKSRGIHNLIDVEAGFEAIKAEGIETTDFICPTTML